MAGDWIKWTKGLARKPEVLRMAEILGLSRHDVAGKLMEFWEWADDNTENGYVPSVTHSSVDGVIGASGFGEAMAKVGWLRVSKGSKLDQNAGIRLPKFDRHNSKTAKTRALTARRVEKHRSNRTVTPDALSREEKRREDRSRKKSKPKERFKPPTLEEVTAYCRERGNSVDPELWMAHYESNGWKVGRNPMKDWRKAVITWERNGRDKQQQVSSTRIDE